MATATIDATTTTTAPHRAKGPLTPAQAELAERYLPVAEGLAAGFAERFAWLSDDFHSAASWALLCAARDYKPEMGFLFFTYARYRIRGALLDVQRAQIPRGYKRASDAQFVPRIEGLEEAGDALVCLLSPVDDADTRQILAGMIEDLPPRQRRAMRLAVLARLDPAEVAEEMGLPLPRVVLLIDDAIDRLRANHYPCFSPEA